MREPLLKFPKRVAGPSQTRITLEECRALLAKRTLSPEMQAGLKQRIAQLEEELRGEAAQRQRDTSSA